MLRLLGFDVEPSEVARSSRVTSGSIGTSGAKLKPVHPSIAVRGCGSRSSVHWLHSRAGRLHPQGTPTIDGTPFGVLSFAQSIVENPCASRPHARFVAHDQHPEPHPTERQ